MARLQILIAFSPLNLITQYITNVLMTRMDFGAQQKLIQLELILVGKEIGERVACYIVMDAVISTFYQT